MTKGLIFKIRTTQDLGADCWLEAFAVIALSVPCIASAGTIMERIAYRAQGQMSQAACRFAE